MLTFMMKTFVVPVLNTVFADTLLKLVFTKSFPNTFLIISLIINKIYSLMTMISNLYLLPFVQNNIIYLPFHLPNTFQKTEMTTYRMSYSQGLIPSHLPWNGAVATHEENTLKIKLKRHQTY